MEGIKILNVQWFNNIGMVTIDNGFEIKTYIKTVRGFNEEEDIKDIIKLGFSVYPNQLNRILKLHAKYDKEE